MDKQKLTRMEKQWILYDVGNSAFIMLVTTIIPIYYKNIALAEGVSLAHSTAYFGYATSISTLIVALLGPILGSISDTRGYKKPLFTLFLVIGVLGCAALALPVPWLVFLGIFVIAKVGYNSSLIFYDSMLTDITTKERMDEVSSQGYAWGYIGSCIPFTISLLFVLFAKPIGISASTATMIAFLLNAVWWFGITIPLLKNYRQKYFVEVQSHPLKESFARIIKMLKNIRKEKGIFLFLLAFLFYIDGVYTIIEMATSYGKDVGIGDNSLLLALLLTQVVAFPCSILFGKLSKKYKTTSLIKVGILGYTGIALFALQLDKAWEFWFLAVCVAVFQGAIQALSRSYFAKIIPEEQAGEYFGLYDIFGKGAAFIGTMMMGISTQISGSSKTGVFLLVLMFAAGFFLFRKADQVNAQALSERKSV